MTEEERFWARINKTDTCWLWTGGVQSMGYGSFYRRGGGYTLAHRYAWEYYNGTIEPGMVIDHLCNVLLCVNPEHLRETTQSQNLQRKIRHCRTCTCGVKNAAPIQAHQA